MHNDLLKNSKSYQTSYSVDGTSSQGAQLPLIENLKPVFRDLNLQDVLIISVQHLCSTTEILFDALLQCHLAPHNLYTLGKCYSTNPTVLTRLNKKGINALSTSSSFQSATPFDVTFEKNITEMLKQIAALGNLYSYKKIIILDDGGHLLEKSCKLLPKNLPIVGIEQTSSGFNRLKDKAFSFPVINLARSWVKLKYESPIILKIILIQIKEKLNALKYRIKKILIIGHGVLGRKIYETLQNKYTVSIFDTVPEKSMIPSADFRRKLSDFDLIIGCTGETSLTEDDFRYLKRPVILASTSSSDREFDASKLRALHPNIDCHSDITAHGMTLLNSGFPINFSNDYDAIDTEDFQLTRALIFASVYQAAFTDPGLKGFISMQNDLQETILEKWNDCDAQIQSMHELHEVIAQYDACHIS